MQGFSNVSPGDPNFSIKILYDPKQKQMLTKAIERGELFELHRVYRGFLDTGHHSSHFYDFSFLKCGLFYITATFFIFFRKARDPNLKPSRPIVWKPLDYRLLETSFNENQLRCRQKSLWKRILGFSLNY